MDDNKVLIVFGILVVGSMFILGQLLVVPTMGTGQAEMKRLKKRLQTLDNEEDELVEMPINVLRERFRKNPSWLDSTLGLIPGLRKLARGLETPGVARSGYVYILISFGLAIVFGWLGWHFIGNVLLVIMFAFIGGSLPFIKLKADQSKRFELFEDQLVGALDLIVRSLKAGYPFADSVRQVAREMDDPVGTEFGIFFDEINGGVDTRIAFRNMLSRVPSLSLMAVATTVALQRETGGNLAETLQNIGVLIRARFKFQRNVKTLTAEARMSAWVMALLPFGLFLIMYFMSPAMMKAFINDPMGVKGIGMGIGMIFLGVLWMRKMLNLNI